MTGIARAPVRRIHSDRVYATLKVATADVVEENGRTERAAGRTRGSAEMLRRASNHACPDYFVHADQVADLEARCSYPWVTAVLAETQGFMLIPTPDRLRKDGITSRTIKEAADAIAVISQAEMSGPGIERSEVPSVMKEVREAILALLAFEEVLKARFPDLNATDLELKQFAMPQGEEDA